MTKSGAPKSEGGTALSKKKKGRLQNEGRSALLRKKWDKDRPKGQISARGGQKKRFSLLFHTKVSSQQRLNITYHIRFCPSKPRAAPTFVGCARRTTATALDWTLSASRSIMLSTSVERAPGKHVKSPGGGYTNRRTLPFAPCTASI